MSPRLPLNVLALAASSALLLADDALDDALMNEYYPCENDEPIAPAYTYSLLCHRMGDVGDVAWDSGEIVVENSGATTVTHPGMSVVAGDFDLREVTVYRDYEQCVVETGDDEPVECLATCENTLEGIRLVGLFVLDGAVRELDCDSDDLDGAPASFRLGCFVPDAVDWSCDMRLRGDEW